MSRYQRKTILVEAIQFTGSNLSDIAYNFNMTQGEHYEVTPGGDVALKTAAISS